MNVREACFFLSTGLLVIIFSALLNILIENIVAVTGLGYMIGMIIFSNLIVLQLCAFSNRKRKGEKIEEISSPSSDKANSTPDCPRAPAIEETWGS